MSEMEIIAGGTAPDAKVPTWGLGEYLAEAGKALRTNLPKAWVDAVVLDAKETRSGLTLELVEPFADERRNGRLRCHMWARARVALEDDLGMSLDVPTLKGTQVRLLLKTAFDPRWHLEGVVEGVDPRMVASLVARKVEQIRDVLRKENLYGAQRLLEAPTDVTNVTVIHPDRAAGWADVRTELERLQASGILTFKSCAVPFEGVGAAGGIADLVAGIADGHRPDLVLIVRGGGAPAGLASLANLSLARAVSRCPVPIITGLGHASDRTIIDDCAWFAADTPSKAVGALKSILRRRYATATDDHRTIVEVVSRLVTGTLQPLLSSSLGALEDVVDRLTAAQSSQLVEMSHIVERHVIAFRGRIALTQIDLDRIAETLFELAPRVPRAAAGDLGTVYGGIVRMTRARLPDRQNLSIQAGHSTGVVRAFVDRQAAQLGAAAASLEAAMRRRLGNEAARLASVASAAQAMDVASTLARGFVLPLDGRRNIIRSAQLARGTECLELLFTDGSVACHPVVS